jgi:multiple sugar transport system substrate-binding protein
MSELRGITWDHPRGYNPLVTTAQSYMALHPNVRIHWERRSLQAFAEESVLDLATRYDLVVLDHPWIGAAVARDVLLPLDDWLDGAFLADQAAQSVGKSYQSYTWGGHQWALAIDAAAQVSAFRPDLVDRLGISLPDTWEAIIRLGAACQTVGEGMLAIPLTHVDTVPTFISLCAHLGEPPMQGEAYVGRAVGRAALEIMQGLVEVCHPASLHWSPPQLLDRMSSTDEIVYCPLLFGYVTYAHSSQRRVQFANIPPDSTGTPAGATLGGAGLAVARTTRHPQIACDYAAYCASPGIQRTRYAEHGGQPGHRSAWCDVAINIAAHNFYRNTLDTLDHAYLRPRYAGYIELQDAACVVLHQFLCEDAQPDRVLDRLDVLYQQSRRGA